MRSEPTPPRRGPAEENPSTASGLEPTGDAPPADDDRLFRALFFVLLAAWMAIPFVLWSVDGPDGITFVAAGLTDPAEVYPDASGRMTEAFVDAECDVVPSGDCSWLSRNSGHFVSPPQAIPPLQLVAPLGVVGGRLLAAAALAATMLLVRQRIGDGPALVTATALASFSAINAIGIGQNAPLLALTAALWLGAHRRAAGAALAVCVALKAWPIALVAVLAWRREWLAVRWFAGILGALTVTALVIAGPGSFASWWTGFRAASPRIEASGINVALQTLIGPAGSALSFALVAWGALRLRRAPTATLWGWGWAASVLLLPVVWASYLLVLIPAASEHGRARPWIVTAVAGGLAVSTLVTPAVGMVTTLAVVAGIGWTAGSPIGAAAD